MAQPYQLTGNNSVTRISDGAVIPFDPKNADYQAYQNWVASGNTPDPAPAVSPLPAFYATVQTTINASDLVMLRVQEAISLGLNTSASADVVAYVNYRRALRALLKATSVQTLPTPPAYPAGT